MTITTSQPAGRTSTQDRRPYFDSMVETLEPRIAPAGLDGVNFQAVTLGTPILLKAGEGIATAEGGGNYLLYVEKGEALIFTTDLNGNNRFDPNEITGIAAGNGLRLTSFVDINGDIVTNLLSNGLLSDSDGDASNGRDGLVLLNSAIESITLRSVSAGDVSTGNYIDRLAPSSYSIHGQIIAGGGFGTGGGRGLVIDTSGIGDQILKFDTLFNPDFQVADVLPNVGGIRTGSAASLTSFSFGYVTEAGPDFGTNIGGVLRPFIPAAGQAGGDIIGIRVGNGAALGGDYTPSDFTIGFIESGNGGIGARGGNIVDVTLLGDSGGLRVVAGDGGRGPTGGNGGSIINLVDLGSVNAMVEIRSGDGGEGFLGKAGAAGNVSFGEFSMNGQVYVGLGSGGTGLLAGGNGTSLLSGTFSPTGEGELFVPVSMLSTYRAPGDIATDTFIDFDGDGLADVMYLTNSPDQLVIRFGSGFSLYLNAPPFADPEERSTGIVVGDFDGDGNLDIAVAPSVNNTTQGIRVFLNDGTWGEQAKLPNGQNYLTDYIHTALPSLSPQSIQRGPMAVVSLLAGDFNHDGVIDLAYAGEVTDIKGKATTYVVTLNGQGDGRFVADFGYDRNLDIQTLSPAFDTKIGHGEAIFQSAAAAQGNSFTDLIAFAQLGKQAVNTITWDGVEYAANSAKGFYFEAQQDSKVDPPLDDNKSFVRDFVIMDTNGDGFFDIVSLGSNDSLVLFEGNGAGEISYSVGVKITGKFSIFGDGYSNATRIVAAPFDIANPNPQVAILMQNLNDDDELSGSAFQTLAINGNNWFDSAVFPNEFPDLDVSGSETIKILAQMNKDWPVFAPVSEFVIPADNALFASIGKIKDVVGFFYENPTANAGFGDTVDLLNNRLALAAGDGGNSHLGAGGSGGGFGSGVLSISKAPDGSSEINAAITIILPKAKDTQPSISITAADGGSGFTSGGAGGSISGLFLRYEEGTNLFTGPAALRAGDGGFSLIGKGGVGGSLSNFSLTFGTFFEAGDGGQGMQGGNGGSVLANSGIANFSTFTTGVSVYSGDGGRGITQGGNGGNIDGFFPIMVTSPPAILLRYEAGDGGGAVAGRGGNGGSVLNSSPSTENNGNSGRILITAGDGGDGQIGGSGGAVGNFQNLPTTFNSPELISILAGYGGTGISGNGGQGGSVNNIVASGTGIGFLGNFNRILAGDGGTSFGAQGGRGGGLSAVAMAANSSAAVAAAGAGGDGLTRGGDGGSVTNSNVNSAKVTGAKVLVVAGAGGNAYAALSTASNLGEGGDSNNILQLRAYGNTNGIGGNGGNISNFTQPLSVNTSVDLIAGNGGGTVNYGSPLDSKTGVGRGGSITNTNLAGNAGNISQTVAIVTYGGPNTNITDFVNDVLRNSPTTEITDLVGNTGVLVGAAGQVKDGNSALDGVNGSVTNFKAKNIMSMVAGSVDRISTIQSINNLTVPGGILGSYKTNPIGPQPNHSPSIPLYFDANGNETNVATPGGSLMDGAILTRTNNSGFPTSGRFFAG